MYHLPSSSSSLNHSFAANNDKLWLSAALLSSPSLLTKMFLLVENRLKTKKLIAELFSAINWIVFAPLTFSLGSPEDCYVQSTLFLISDWCHSTTFGGPHERNTAGHGHVIIITGQWPHSFFFTPHLMIVILAFVIPGNEPAVSPTFIIAHRKLIWRSASRLSHRCERCQADK